MVVKLVDKNDNEKLFPCDHIEVTRYAPGSKALEDFCRKTGTSEDEAAGIEINMVNWRGRDRRSVLIPTDYEVAYVTNDRGATVGIYRWPERPEARKEAVG